MKLSKNRKLIDKKQMENILFEEDLTKSKYKENCKFRRLINVLTNAAIKN